MKIMPLVPVNLDAYVRIRKCLDPQNLEVMHELLFPEALSDKTMEEILLSEQKQVFWFDLLKRSDEVRAVHGELAGERNAHLVYFQYQEQIQAAAGDKNVALPGDGERL